MAQNTADLLRSDFSEPILVSIGKKVQALSFRDRSNQLANCEKLHKCPFHSGRLAQYSPSVLQSMMRVFCKGEPDRCARLLLKNELGEEHVPEDLTPTDLLKALEIIRDFSRKNLVEETEPAD